MTAPFQLRKDQAEFSTASGLRVALFSGNYNYTRDGANNALNRLASNLLERGAAVRVYSPTSKDPAFPHVGDLVSVPSIPIPIRRDFRVALGLPSRLRDDLRAFHPNVVHLSAPDWLGSSAQRFAEVLGVPIVASMHTRFETYFKYYGLGALSSWARRRQQLFYGRCDRVLAPNEACKTHLESLGVLPRRITVWGRGVDSKVFSPAARDPNWRRGLGYKVCEQIVLFFGRVVWEKGLHEFVAAIRELRKRGHRICPLVVGDGPAAGKFRRSLGEARFVGHLEGRDLARAIASSDILLNPSITEAFGNVNLEAMACGLAVVSADVGSARSLINHGVNGVLSPPGARNLADAIEPLLKEPWRFSSLRARAVLTARQRQWPEVLESAIDAYWKELDRSRCKKGEGK